MKKLLVLVLTFCMLMSLVGCTTTPLQTEPTETESTEPITSEPTTVPTPTAVPQQADMFSVSLPIAERTEYHADGTTLFTQAWQEMALILPDPDVASKVTIHYQNCLESYNRDAANILISAEDEYRGQEDWTAYRASTYYNVKRIDSNVLSLHGTYSSFSGASHPTHLTQSLNYNLITGDHLTLEEILQNNTADTLVQMLGERLKAVSEEKPLYPDYMQILSDLLGFGDFSNWYFNEEGLCFCFSPYEIAPYASGIVEAVLPYDRLQGILDDAYFPMEWAYEGTVYAQPFNQAVAEQYTQTSEVTLNEDALGLMLHSGNTAVANVIVEYGAISPDDGQFLSTATIFACATLTPGDAAILRVKLSDDIPQLRISYQCGNQIISKLIVQSSDSSILLND